MINTHAQPPPRGRWSLSKRSCAASKPARRRVRRHRGAGCHHAACGFVSVGGALFIGFAAGVACFWGVSWLKNLFGYDDALDVWGVHGVVAFLALS